MARFLSTFTFVVFFQACLVKSFLLNTNTSYNLHSPGQATGSEGNTILYLLQKVDSLQLQIHQQSKTMEELNKIQETQNKTMEAQKSVILELLNFSRQTPSTVSLSNNLSILEMHVQRIMDEYQRLSNTSDTTDLTSKINSMANSVRVLTTFLSIQGSKINEMNNEFRQHVNGLNVSLLSNANSLSQNERDISNHFLSISSSLSRLSTEMTDLVGRVSSLEANITFVTKTRVGFTVGVTDYSNSWSGDILVFPHVVTNTGDVYNISTGKFTSPKAGTYVFFITAVSYGRNGLSLDIVHNDASKVRAYSTDSASGQTGTNLVVLALDQGDTVWVRRVWGRGYYSALGPWTTFSGFFL